MRILRARLLLALVFGGIVLCWPALAQDEPLTAQALVERQQVFAGEPFVLQIRVSGSENPDPPNVSGLTGFSVVDMGGSQNSSQSVTIINGRMNRVVQRGYIFNYQLTAKQTGDFTIPALTVAAEGKTVRTQAISIRVVPPQENDNLKLRVSLSESEAYVGQPVVMTVTFYIGQNVNTVAFTVPVLDDSRFRFSDPRIQVDPDRHLQLPLNGGQVIVEKKQETLEGTRYLTVSFRKVLVPRESGTFTFPQATVAGKVLSGYQRRRSGFGDIFDDPFFSDFARQAVYDTFVAPSNRPALRVLDLPAAGRPPDFSGLIGTYQISAEASPTEVNVGDPITVKLRVSGTRYLDQVELPPLAEQPALANDFRIPSEQAAGVVRGDQKEFSQTFRARHANVTAIPPIELNYFNPRSRTFEVARTEPIPLTVHGTRVVTALDAEGLDAPPTAGSEVESSEGGIAYNYEGSEVLRNQSYGPAAWLSNPAWLVGLGLPPLVFLGLLGFTAFERWRHADPEARAARQAHGRFTKNVEHLEPADTDAFYAAMLNETRQYLGARLSLPPGALTFSDVRPPLAERGTSEEVLASLKHIIDRCEAGRYAGAAYAGESPQDLKKTALETVAQLEEAIR